MKKSVIAIDGPAGAGKSTIAKMAAKKLNYIYIDTGAMYRGVAWLVLQKYQVPVNTAQVLSVIEDINIRLAYDDNGNMTIMLDKGISSISYNYLDLPTNIAQGSRKKTEYKLHKTNY